MVFIGGGPVSSEYARAVKIERETREREKRLERRDRRERNEGPENSYTVKVLVFQTSLDSNVFNCPGTVQTFLLPSPGLVKTPPPPPLYEMWASPLLPAAPLRPRPRGRRQRTFLRHGSSLRPAFCADTHASVRRGKTVERNLNTNGHGMKRRMCTNGLHRWRPRKQ